MEEIQAKDKIMQECRATINSRDGSLQKFIKQNGCHTQNPKEEAYTTAILQNLDKSMALQDEKIILADKTSTLLDRQVRRLDIKIRELQNDGILTSDTSLPSLLLPNPVKLESSRPLFSNPSTPQTTYTTSLGSNSGNAGGQYPAAHQMNPSQSLNTTSASPSPSLSASQTASTNTNPPDVPVRNSAPAAPAAFNGGNGQFQRQRESSAGAIESKRRRLNSSLGTLPTAPSNLRQSSVGPGATKPSIPGSSSSRAGSAGPRAAITIKKPAIKKVAPHQQVRRVRAAATGKILKRSSGASGRLKPGEAVLAGRQKSPGSTTAGAYDEEELLSSVDGEEKHERSEEDAEEEEEAGEDTEVYCTCRSVSHGDMVACDNDDCPYEWFHWKCVGLTREPPGTWYCEECRKNLGK